MNVFKETSEYSPYISEIFRKYFGDLKIGFFDIETTGLSPERCKVILAGLAIPDTNAIRTIQILADDPSEEPQVLRALLDELDKLDMVITFNGKMFDMPFVEKRCAKAMVHMNRPLPYNLDMYQAIKGHSPLRRMLPNLKQKTVEDFLGLWEHREDEISGADSVELYYIYAGEKDERLRDVILLHNHDDIVQLSKLIKILDRCNLHSYIFRNGFTLGGLIIDTIELRKKSLTIRGTQRDIRTDARYYGIPDAEFISDDRSFAVRLPLTYAEGLVLADMEQLPFEMDDTVEGYLILAKDKDVEYEAVNRLAMNLIEHILKELE